MIRQAFTSWARSIGFVVDLPEDPTDDDKKYQEFLYSVFTDMEGGETVFKDTLVNHVPFMGWGWWEVVPGLRTAGLIPPGNDTWRSQNDDGLIGIRRLAWRDPGTFYKWEFDEKKKMRALVQQDYPNPTVTLPLVNSLHITYGDPNNPEGLSPLEAVWRCERIKFGLEVVQGIGFEHAAGYLNIEKTIEGMLTDADKTNIREAAKYILSAQEGNYASWPFGIKGEVMDIPFSAAPSLLSAIQHYSMLVLSVYTMQWMALNTMTATGSFSMAKDSSSMGVMTFNSMMDGFADQLDNQVGKKLYEWNKDAFPNLTKRPIIRFEHIDKDLDLNEMATFVSTIKGVMPLGDEDYLAIRLRSGFLPETLPEVEEVPEEIPEDEVPEDETPEDETPEDEAPEEPAEEQAPDFAKIEQTLRDAIVALESEPKEQNLADWRSSPVAQPDTFNINVPQPVVDINIQPPAVTINQAVPNVTVNMPEQVIEIQAPDVVVQNIPAPEVNVMNEVVPTPVEITNQITNDVRPADVTVVQAETPIVNVAVQAPTVNIEKQDPPIVTVNNEIHPNEVVVQNIPAPQVVIENTIQPTPIEITNEVHPADVTVTEAQAPIVNVTNRIQSNEPDETDEVLQEIRELSKHRDHKHRRKSK